MADQDPVVEDKEDGGEFDQYGEKTDADGAIIALSDDRKHKLGGDLPNEWCIVAFGKWGTEVTRIFPISKETGDKAAVEAWRQQHIVPHFGGDTGKHTTQLMPSKDFILMVS